MTDKKNDLFFKARGIADSAERRAFLNEACADTPELVAEVEGLLAAEEGSDGLFEATTLRYHPGAGSIERPGQRIGRYKLLEEIGEGGGGVVYMAQQSEPVRRRVALKVIKPGMDTRQVIARFEAERQALAMMDHPNIAKVLDAGTTETGRSYFVMELVRGEPVTKFCDKNKLRTRDRLELFIQICQAVQHAHQKGIIHRDIKPGNVLVTMLENRPSPVIIDFGVAKAIQQELTEMTLFTRHGHFIGTPAYMSPEQASLNAYDVDTRSDVYALGVLLYELLTGTTPFSSRELHKAGYHDIRRVLAEDEPPMPSTRLSTLKGEELSSLAASRQTSPHRLGRLVRGDLDWIVMKALEKDRRRRYQSAAEFAQDISRFLADEPIEARRPRITYKLGKFAKRNKAAVTVALLLTAIVSAGFLEATAHRRERERLAHQERERLFHAAAESRAALIGEKLKNIERIVEQYRKGAVRLLTLPSEHLPYRDPTPAGHDGIYYDADFYHPARRPPGMVYDESYGKEVSWEHVNLVRPRQALREDVEESLLEERRLARMNEVFSLIHPEQDDIMWSFAGSSSGVFVGYPGFGRYRDKPDFDPRSRTWYRNALGAHGDRQVWTGPYSDASTTQFMISCVAPVSVAGRHAGVVGVDVPMHRIQDWLRNQVRFPDKTRCLILVPPDRAPDPSSRLDYRVFVDTTFNPSAKDWRSVLEPRRMDELASPLREFARDVASRKDTAVAPVIEDGMLMASARIEALDWLVIAVRKSE